ncbi:MAG: hypothetical protein H6667_25185 [Ardenticatenaceae bacterium]|nr:hypothetical protein [Ardenticatenaceae bacterium]
MIGDQPPLADVLTDLGQWLQEWATFVQSQIETQAARSGEEVGLSPVSQDESGVVPAGQTAVPLQPSSPPAHWLALFAEQGGRSLEEATADAETASPPIEFETRQIDTAVLSDWITQIYDDILAFRRQVDPQFSVEQFADVPEVKQSEGAPVYLVEDAGNAEGNDEMPLIATPTVQKTTPQQIAHQPHSEPHPEERAEIGMERPLPPPAILPTRSSLPIRNTSPQRPLTDASTIQRKVDPASEPLMIKEHLPLDTTLSSAPKLPDEGMIAGRDPNPDWSSLSHPRRPEFKPVETETGVERPELPQPAPVNVPDSAQPPHTIKRVTRLRLNPLLLRKPPAAQKPWQTPIVHPPDRAIRQPVVEDRLAEPVENHPDTTVAPEPIHPADKLESSTVESRLKTAVPPPDFWPLSTGEPIPQPFLPPQKTGQSGKTIRVRAALTTNQIQPPIIQTTVAPQLNSETGFPQTKPPLPPVVESRLVRDSGEAERQLPPNPLSAPSLRLEPADDGEAKRPLPPQTHPDYQTPPPAGPRQPPQWSVTPENRWPSLPPLPSPAPNSPSTWRQQPARRQRLDREQQGTSWNE